MLKYLNLGKKEWSWLDNCQFMQIFAFEQTNPLESRKPISFMSLASEEEKIMAAEADLINL